MTDVLDATKAKHEVFMHRWRKVGVCAGVNKCTYTWEVWKWLQRQYGYFTINRWEQGHVPGTFVMLGNSQTLVEKEQKNMTLQRAHPDYIQVVDLIHSEGVQVAWDQLQSYK